MITREPIRNSGELRAYVIRDQRNSQSRKQHHLQRIVGKRHRKRGHHALRATPGKRRVTTTTGMASRKARSVENRSFGFRSFTKTGVYSRLSLEYQIYMSFAGEATAWTQPFEAYITEQVEHYINGGSLKYDHF